MQFMKLHQLSIYTGCSLLLKNQSWLLFLLVDYVIFNIQLADLVYIVDLFHFIDQLFDAIFIVLFEFKFLFLLLDELELILLDFIEHKIMILSFLLLDDLFIVFLDQIHLVYHQLINMMSYFIDFFLEEFDNLILVFRVSEIIQLRNFAFSVIIDNLLVSLFNLIDQSRFIVF